MGASRQDDLADVLPALDEAVGVGDAVERERFRDDRGAGVSARSSVEQHVHERRQLRALLPQVADVQAEDAAVAVDQRQRIETRR